ncbi:MAG TPA: hypothetical protein VM597_06110 [Gemmataceae bacterium]|jgi:hypothetical protein|nr:hypothetical protein [Gemmataceae bacterium]
MTDQHLFWAALGGLGLLALFCLPVTAFAKVVLELSALVLRVTLLGVLAAGAYLGFRPGDMPSGLAAVLNDFPALLAYLPDRASPLFAPCLAMTVVAVLLPVLAALDVARGLAGRRMRRLRRLADEPPAVVETVRHETEVRPLRPVDRRTAATTITTAAAHRRVPVA